MSHRTSLSKIRSKWNVWRDSGVALTFLVLMAIVTTWQFAKSLLDADYKWIVLNGLAAWFWSTEAFKTMERRADRWHCGDCGRPLATDGSCAWCDG